MNLKNHYEPFRDALLKAFNEEELRQNLRFDFDFPYNQSVSGDTAVARVYSLIDTFDREGRVDELFLKLFARRPGNPAMKDLAQQLAADVEEQHGELAEFARSNANNNEYENPAADELRAGLQSYTTTGVLEALVFQAPHLQSGQEVEAWEEGFTTARGQICLIRKGTRPVGTGFLVGPDRILTNSHVVPAGATAADFDVVFDYCGKDPAIAALPKARLVEELARSQPRECDYAIYRLDKVPGGKRGQKRGYFRPSDYSFQTIREPISVLGHPNGNSLTITFGVIFDINSFLSRVAYTANTAPGSSGSPVFTENWDLVALHHHGETNVNNHGIPMQAIFQDLAAKGLSNLLIAPLDRLVNRIEGAATIESADAVRRQKRPGRVIFFSLLILVLAIFLALALRHSTRNTLIGITHKMLEHSRTADLDDRVRLLIGALRYSPEYFPLAHEELQLALELKEKQPITTETTIGGQFVAFSPEGGHFAVAGGRSIAVFQSSDPKAPIKFETNWSTPIVMLSADAHYVAAIDNGMLRIWNKASQKELEPDSPFPAVRDAAFRGTDLIALWKEGGASILSLPTLASTPLPLGFAEGHKLICLSPDGSMAAASLQNGNQKLTTVYNLSSGKQIGNFPNETHLDASRSRFSMDGKCFVAVENSPVGGKVIRVCDLETMQFLSHESADNVDSVAFDTRHKVLSVVSDRLGSGRCRLINITSHTTEELSEVSAVDYSPDGRFQAMVHWNGKTTLQHTENALLQRDRNESLMYITPLQESCFSIGIAGRNCVLTYDPSMKATSVAFQCEEGERLLCATSDGRRCAIQVGQKVRVIQIEGRLSVDELPVATSEVILAGQFSQDGKLLAVLTATFQEKDLSGSRSDQTKVWTLQACNVRCMRLNNNGRPCRQFSIDVMGSDAPSSPRDPRDNTDYWRMPLSVSPSGDFITIMNRGKTFDGVTGNSPCTRFGGGFPLHYGATLVVTQQCKDDLNRTLELWNPSNGQHIRSLALPTQACAHSVVVTSDEQLIAATCDQDRVYVWQRRNGEIIAQFRGSKGGNSIGFDTNKNILGVSTTGAAALWKTQKDDLISDAEKSLVVSDTLDEIRLQHLLSDAAYAWFVWHWIP